MTPKISFIMPIYNGRKYIRDAITSIKKTVRRIPWEVLIWDDASTDSNGEDLEYIKTTCNAEIGYGKERIGAANVRNLLIPNARAEVLYILDCDNILEYGCVEKMYNMIDICSVVSTAKLKFFGFKHPTRPDSSWEFDKSRYGLQEMITSLKTPPSSGNYMMKKSVWSCVQGYHKEDIQETWGFGMRHVAAGYPVFTCPGTSYLHRYCKHGYYNELPKDQMDIAFRDRILAIKDQLAPESLSILEEIESGKKIISSGRLKIK